MRILSTILLTAAAFAASSEGLGYRLLTKIPVPGEGNWDYLAIDEASRRLYVSHGQQVEVIDIDKDRPVGKIGGMNGVHGIAIARPLNRGFITSGNTSTVKMFDLETLAPLADIPAGNGPDGVVYEPVTDSVFAFNHRGSTLTVIDAKAGKAVKNIELGGQPEFPVTDKGVVWVNLENVSTLVKIDATSLNMEKWPAPCKEPASMDIDRKTRRLFIGCNDEKMGVAEADSGKAITTVPIGVHVDATAFDPMTKLIFNANRGSVTIVHQDSPDKYSVVQTLAVAPRANTLALDHKTHKLYLSAADFETIPAAGADSKPRQKMIPNTFAIYVYGK